LSSFKNLFFFSFLLWLYRMRNFMACCWGFSKPCVKFYREILKVFLKWYFLFEITAENQRFSYLIYFCLFFIINTIKKTLNTKIDLTLEIEFNSKSSKQRDKEWPPFIYFSFSRWLSLGFSNIILFFHFNIVLLNYIYLMMF
jgi:hypothetical protein